MKQSRALRGRNPARDSQVEGAPLACMAPVERWGPFLLDGLERFEEHVQRGNVALEGSGLNRPDGTVDDEREGASAVGGVKQGEDA